MRTSDRLLRRRALYTCLVLLPFWSSLAACGTPQPTLSDVAAQIGIAESESPLSFFRRTAINRVLDYRVWSGARAGFVALVANQDGLLYARSAGHADLETGQAMALDTRFHIASMTKPVIAVAAMILIEEDRLRLQDPVSEYIPEFAHTRVLSERIAADEWKTEPLATPITVRHLLTFTSGIGGYAETEDPLDLAWRSPDIELEGLGTLADRVDLIPRLPLYEQPGTAWRYGWSADVLARVVEVAAGQPLTRFLRERIFVPLGLDHTGYPDEIEPGVPFARMYTHDEDGELIREPRFDDYYGSGWTPGGGGLVSSARDYLRFALMLARGGSLGGVRILKESSVAEMTQLHVPDGVLADMGLEGLGWGFGVCVVADESKTIMPASNGDYWWSGRFGTQFWISPSSGTVVVVMQQTETGPYSDMPVTPTLVQVLAIP